MLSDLIYLYMTSITFPWSTASARQHFKKCGTAMSVVAAATVPLSTLSSSIVVVVVLVEKSLLLEGHH